MKDYPPPTPLEELERLSAWKGERIRKSDEEWDAMGWEGKFNPIHPHWVGRRYDGSGRIRRPLKACQA